MALLDNIPGFKVFSVGVGLAALALVGWLVYANFFKPPDDLKELQREALSDALERLSEHYADQVRRLGEQRVVVMPVLGDTTNGEIRHRTFERLNAVAGVKAIKPPDPDLEERATGIFKSILGKQPNEADPAKVFERAGEADEVIQISAKVVSGADSGRCDFQVMRIVRAAGKDRAASIGETLTITGLSGSAKPQAAEDDGSGFWASLWAVVWRALAVLAATAALPFMSWPLARFVFARDSNTLNGLLWLGLTLLDVAVLFATVSFELSTPAVVCALLLLPLGGFINLRVLNAIEEHS
ncbi:MAG: hypothetical protein BroJett014_13710 [Planctomycetota bacterium]|nr:hypothetical protein [Planctomycetota bacterium]GIK52398.1 MAG: hypothetical protein BroJett014_13710 [Planctomycetota bacterium]